MIICNGIYQNTVASRKLYFLLNLSGCQILELKTGKWKELAETQRNKKSYPEIGDANFKGAL